MNRRDFLGGCAAAVPALAAATTVPAQPAAQSAAPLMRPVARELVPLWSAWKLRHLDFTGRVIDRLQSNASHSEGQGYGMVLAVAMGDEPAFTSMMEWTEAHLARRRDNLLSWRWLPESLPHVPDPNNAADGDLFVAWALLRASRRFGRAEWAERAGRIAGDLVRHCIIAAPYAPSQRLLIPAADGFETPDGHIINLSYTMPLAMRELAEGLNLPPLAEAARGGEELLTRLAADGLTPDWIEVTPEGPRISPRFSANAGYEAIRAPLFLVWSNDAAHPAVGAFRTAWAPHAGNMMPTVMERQSNRALEFSSHPGYAALPALVECAARRGGGGSAMPPFTPDQPYYPATLHMFAALAQTEAFPRCVPI
ncbi:MAG: twin-arginine translocation signal domain-containing protein [Rhodobacteraceae bacterium]|nr:twin-arginine translocation signal domain-containing protein [Paracoccaceae bacterium]